MERFRQRGHFYRIRYESLFVLNQITMNHMSANKKTKENIDIIIGGNNRK